MTINFKSNKKMVIIYQKDAYRHSKIVRADVSSIIKTPLGAQLTYIMTIIKYAKYKTEKFWKTKMGIFKFKMTIGIIFIYEISILNSIKTR